MYSDRNSRPVPRTVDLSRRRFVTGAASALAAASLPLSMPAMARRQYADAPAVLEGNQFDLTIGHRDVNLTGRDRVATTVNGSLPSPVLRWKEGEQVVLRVHNTMDVDSSLHWHGLILPPDMDGVPGISFDGIGPGETFEYRFDVRQSGTYWYHSHSGYQEQTGLYGAIIIDPAEPDPVEYDREHVILLSDWSDEDPEHIFATLKKESHYYNFQQRTVGDLWRDIREKGIARTFSDRAMWNNMRMSDRDLADVTGYTYTYLMNGVTPDTGWTGAFEPGEKVRLRFINGSSMTFFDIRIPGLKMTVVAADGQNVRPVPVDEFRIGTAETYDVIVTPDSRNALTVFAQSSDRSGYARGTLTPEPGMTAPVPDLDATPVLGHRDMGMGHEQMGDMETDHSAMDHQDTDHAAMDHSAAQHGGNHMAPAGMGNHQADSFTIRHPESEYGPGVDMRAEMPANGLTDPGLGLRDHGDVHDRRVLTYADLRGLHPTRDTRNPGREIQLHLTGNMKRYMWSIDGIPFAEAEPLQFEPGERLRIVLVNDTMMAHPIHLHGMWSELETGDPDHIPRKHTVIAQPGSTVSYLVTPDAPGSWAFHCHLLYHMHGMMREVHVGQADSSPHSHAHSS